MQDLISRRAAIDALLHNQEVYSNNFGTDAIDKYTIAIIDNDVQTIAQLPSAQPEIIRCKDCKHRDAEDGFCKGRGWPMQLVPEDGFCDKGERRSEDE